MARKTRYDPAICEQVAYWARDGLIDEEIAKRLGIHISTLYEWKKRYTEFSDALKKGKEVIDYQVEDSLLKRALGFEYEEKTFETVPDLDTGGHKLVCTKVVTKIQPPDTTAQIFWLKNRQPKKWRDKQEIEHSGAVGLSLSHLTDAELEAELKRLRGEK